MKIYSSNTRIVKQLGKRVTKKLKALQVDMPLAASGKPTPAAKRQHGTAASWGGHDAAEFLPRLGGQRKIDQYMDAHQSDRCGDHGAKRLNFGGHQFRCLWQKALGAHYFIDGA